MKESLLLNRRLMWRELRAKQKEKGIKPRPRASLTNGKAGWQTVEEERAGRWQVVEECHKVWRVVLPVLLKRLAKIPDPRNPRSSKHKLQRPEKPLTFPGWERNSGTRIGLSCGMRIYWLVPGPAGAE
ncbi:MAG: hypothetical protein D9V47_05045 [Clostridia bacterium]|nr:MAG: hypothetical protein D9V47_05045 [Clostridia bacterium]